jgi:hypothetical protein
MKDPASFTITIRFPKERRILTEVEIPGIAEVAEEYGTSGRHDPAYASTAVPVWEWKFS